MLEIKKPIISQFWKVCFRNIARWKAISNNISNSIIIIYSNSISNSITLYLATYPCCSGFLPVHLLWSSPLTSHLSGFSAPPASVCNYPTCQLLLIPTSALTHSSLTYTSCKLALCTFFNHSTSFKMSCMLNMYVWMNVSKK